MKINIFGRYRSKVIAVAAVIALVLFSAGCATRSAYFKLDPSLQREIQSFGGAQYVPLARLCDVYGLDCKSDDLINTATIQRKSGRIVLRAGSGTILVNGAAKRLERPVVMSGGSLFVPVSFAKNVLGPIIGTAPVEVTPEPAASKTFTIRTIVIDPGHGGRDAGATGRRLRLREKHMALHLAKKVKSILEKSGIKIIMTRDDDTFISLPKRTKIANRDKADLFVSIHLNASRSRFMRGFECYYLSEKADDNTRALEAFEDSSLKGEEWVSAERSKRLDRTLLDMALTENRIESAQLSGYICDAIENSFTIGNRGVRSAGFYVLKYTRMPAVLVEAGYISNRYEELKLKDPDFLDRIAEAIARGILNYKLEYERTERFTRQ
ncbi:MAG: N-acetylmuramoyl-L-alanine amidase [Candidatus Omnitrophota bacterium]|nr:N-acetylmuramoyl-L-alanine amidase [Candidatus Omnitrophota bacterium]